MEIHKPKPWHGWREFLREVGTIVLGVLIAIAAEQAVEALHHRHMVGHGEEALRDNFSRFVDPSLARRVADLERGPRPIDEAAYARLDRDYMKRAPIVPFGTRTLVASFSGRVDLRGFVWSPTFETDLTSLRFKHGAAAGK